ncbi:hypothetical protein WA026_001752 [Henosepilachna vigintioctopunctata]|uniref:Uncharacterized protein n=1 Tax=Henosepilachna vigintioctopunctata TaxID=420089 RepID=A0AAW1UR89_9CUCU
MSNSFDNKDYSVFIPTRLVTCRGVVRNIGSDISEEDILNKSDSKCYKFFDMGISNIIEGVIKDAGTAGHDHLRMNVRISINLVVCTVKVDSPPQIGPAQNIHDKKE